MSLYPSLEDMKMDQMVKAQIRAYAASAPSVPHPADNEMALQPSAPNFQTLYPALGEFMGLELSKSMIAENMPEYAIQPTESPCYPTTVSPCCPTTISPCCPNTMIAPLTDQNIGFRRAQVTNGIRELTLCKGTDSKVGIRAVKIDNGVFVSLVIADSPAAKVGLRFGDQILQINGENVAGYSMDQVHLMLKHSPLNGITMIVRDRPFERTITLHKDSTGYVGCHFKNGKISSIVKDSSAARNGVLINHHLLEVQGQNVVGMKDKEIARIIDEGGDIITMTVIPSFLYEHMVKKMSKSLIKTLMDHSVIDC